MGFYQKLFASKYDSFMGSIEKEFVSLRKEMIQDLKGSILEVGAGTGVNFEHFNIEADVIAIEPSQYMLDKAIPKLSNIRNITTYNIGMGDTKMNKIIADNSLDYVICTLVLCTIPKPKEALQDFKRWLKPNGKLIVLEHIHAKEKGRKVIQNIVNPAWKIVGDGCNLNRNTDLFIKEAGFKMLNEAYFKRTLRFYKGVFRL